MACLAAMWWRGRCGIATERDRALSGARGLDDFAGKYPDVTFELVGLGTRTEASAQRAVTENEQRVGRRPRAYHGETPWEDILNDHPDLDVLVVGAPGTASVLA